MDVAGKFQSLIGKIQTPGRWERRVRYDGFQSLIGKIQTITAKPKKEGLNFEFQSLIGKIQTTCAQVKPNFFPSQFQSLIGKIQTITDLCSLIESNRGFNPS